MIKKITFTFLFISISLFAYIDEPYHDSAFIGPPNTFYGLSYFSYYKTEHFWNQNGKRLPSFNKFNRKSYRLDMEYDINCKHAVYLKGGYTMVDERLNGRSRGIEDPEASWQYLFCGDACSALSGRVTAIIPVGPKKSCVRYGKFGAEFKLLYSRIVEVLCHECWYDLGFGYRAYTGFPSDQIRADVSLGCTIRPNIWILSSTQLYYGLFNGKSKANRNNICFNPNFRLITTQVQGIVQVHRYLAFNAGGFFHLWGENIGAGGGAYGGMWLIF